MSDQIVVPIIVKSVEVDDVIGGPATFINKIKGAASSVVANLVLDEESLKQSTNSALSLIGFIQKHLNNNNSKVKIDALTVEMGVSLTGKVGFGGSGLDSEFATVFQITFKIDQ